MPWQGLSFGPSPLIRNLVYLFQTTNLSIIVPQKTFKKLKLYAKEMEIPSTYKILISGYFRVLQPSDAIL